MLCAFRDTLSPLGVSGLVADPNVPDHNGPDQSTSADLLSLARKSSLRRSRHRPIVAGDSAAASFSNLADQTGL
jgi:hypothetical protein